MTDREKRLTEIRGRISDVAHIGVYGDVAWLLDQLAERDRELGVKTAAWDEAVCELEEMVSALESERNADKRRLAEAYKLVGELADIIHQICADPSKEIRFSPAVQEALKARQSERSNA